MNHIYEQQRIDHPNVRALWGAFLDGAGVFGADLPRLTSRDIPDDPRAAVPAILAVIVVAALARGVEKDEITPAGFEMEITPCALWVRFGSGRSVIAICVGDSVGSYVITGLRSRDDEMADPDSARASAQERHAAALASFTSVASAPCSNPTEMRQPRIPTGSRCGACDDVFPV